MVQHTQSPRLDKHGPEVKAFAGVIFNEKDPKNKTKRKTRWAGQTVTVKSRD